MRERTRTFATRSSTQEIVMSSFDAITKTKPLKKCSSWVMQLKFQSRKMVFAGVACCLNRKTLCEQQFSAFYVADFYILLGGRVVFICN